MLFWEKYWNYITQQHMQLNKIDPIWKETLSRRDLINTKATKPFLPKTRSIVVKRKGPREELEVSIKQSIINYFHLEN